MRYPIPSIHPSFFRIFPSPVLLFFPLFLPLSVHFERSIPKGFRTRFSIKRRGIPVQNSFSPAMVIVIFIPLLLVLSLLSSERHGKWSSASNRKKSTRDNTNTHTHTQTNSQSHTKEKKSPVDTETLATTLHIIILQTEPDPKK